MALTHWKKLHNPDYLGAYALEPGKDLVGTIKNVTQEMVPGADGKKEECPILHFAESSIKPMVLNVTNAKTIEKMLKTPFVEEWAGHKISMFIQPNIKVGKEVVDGVRIRPIPPKTTRERLTPDSPRWCDAVKAIVSGGTTIDAIKKKMDLSPEHERLLIEQAAGEVH